MPHPHLAAQLGQQLSLPIIHLDEVYWEPGGFSLKRPSDSVAQDIERYRMGSQWIVEGVFGELAIRFVDRADGFFWLNMDWIYCHSNLLQRGSQSSQQLDPELADANFHQLIVWASNYWKRDNLRSYQGHKALFDAFPGAKYLLQSREEVDRCLANLSRSCPL